jgi:hypothetical protein
MNATIENIIKKINAISHVKNSIGPRPLEAIKYRSKNKKNISTTKTIAKISIWIGSDNFIKTPRIHY